MPRRASGPRRLADFIAQHRVRDQLDLLLNGAMGRGTPPDHILLSGPPGLGKPVSVDALVLLADGTRRRLGDIVVGRSGDHKNGRAGPRRCGARAG